MKRAQKPSFIKIVNIAPILAYIYDMALRPLPLGVGTTIELCVPFARQQNIKPTNESKA